MNHFLLLQLLYFIFCLILLEIIWSPTPVPICPYKFLFMILILLYPFLIIPHFDCSLFNYISYDFLEVLLLISLRMLILRRPQHIQYSNLCYLNPSIPLFLTEHLWNHVFQQSNYQTCKLDLHFHLILRLFPILEVCDQWWTFLNFSKRKGCLPPAFPHSSLLQVKDCSS